MEDNKENKLKPKKRKWLRRFVFMAIIISILFEVFLLFFATPVLKKYMQEKVHQNTKGLYSIDFDKISIELGSRRISLDNFKLIPDTVVYNSLLNTGEAKSAIYQIHARSIELKGTRFYKLLFTRQFKAKELVIKNPVVKLKKLPSKKDKTSANRDFIHKDLFPTLEKHLDHIELRYLKLENGKFHLSLNKDSVRNTTHYGFISVKLDHFLLNKKEFEQKTRLFYADDVQILVDDYRVKLGDGIHVMFADTLYVSTKESLLKAKTVGIKPDIELPQYLSGLKSNYYYINAPEIQFKDFNISNLYFNQDIEIQSITVNSPDIKLINKLIGKKTSFNNESKEIDFYKLMKKKLKSVSIKTLDFTNAKFKFYYNSHLETPLYEIGNYNLSLTGFFLDQYAKDDQSRILYSKNIQLNISNFLAHLKTNSHLLSAGKINLNTKAHKLYVENINLKPLKSKRAKSQVLNINLSKLDIQGADFFKLYHKKIFTINKLVAKASTSNIKLFVNKDKQKRQSKRVLSGLIGKFIKNLYVKNIHVHEAGFKIASYQKDSLLNRFEGKVKLNLERFHFVENKVGEDPRIFHSEKYKIELFKYSQFLNDHLHILKVDEVYMSNTDSLLKFSKLSILPKIKLHQKLISYNKSKLINLHVESSVVSGIDISRAYANKDLSVKNISISRPLFKLLNFTDIKVIENDSALVGDFAEKLSQTDSLLITDSIIQKNTVAAMLSDYFQSISINKFTLKKGSFSFIDVDSLDNKDLIMSGNLSTTIKYFDYDYGADVESYGFANSKDLSLDLQNFYRKTADNKYQIKIKKVKLSSKDSIFRADIIRLFPNHDMPDSLYNNIIWTIYSPKLETKGIDVNAFLNQNILDLGTLKLVNPSFTLITQEKGESVTDNVEEKKTNKTSFPFEKIIVDSLIVVNGGFGILKDKFDLANQTLNTGFSINLSGFQIDSNSVKNPIETFKHINTIIHLKKFKYLLPKNNYIVDVNCFDLNSEKEILQLDSVNYHPQNLIFDEGDKRKSGLEALQVPLIKFKAFSFEKLLDKKLVSDSVFINKPNILLANSNSAKTESKNPLELNLYEKIKNAFKGVNLSHICVNDASFRIKNTKGFNTEITDYNKIYGTISNLIIDSLHQYNKNKLFNTSDIAIRIKDYGFNLKNDLYKIRIKELGFSTGLKKVYANLISMNPTVGRDVLAEKAKNEVKLLHLNTDKLVINEFNFQAFLADKKIIAQKIDIYGTKLHSYKNKQFPMDSVLKIALPLDSLLSAKSYINIDTINIDNSYIGVEILGANSTETGYFDISQINGLVTGISNDKELINNGLNLRIKADGLIMDEGLLNASFRFPLNSKFGEYFYGGKLYSMNMASFNPILENLFFVSIREGVIDSMNFYIDANEDYADGEMKFAYNNLKFDIRNKKNSDSLIVSKRSLASMAANSIVKDNNPRRKRGRFKKGRVYYERDVYHTIFHYWTLSALSGIQSTMGFKSKQLKERIKLEKINKKQKKKDSRNKPKIKRKEKKRIKKEINNDLIKEAGSN